MYSDRLPQVDVLIITAADDFLRCEHGDDYIDPVWVEVCGILGTRKCVNYSHGSTDFLAELRVHKMRMENINQYWRLHPQLRSWRGELFTGRYILATINGRKVCAFASDLRLNTDGPTVPVMRLLPQIISEAKPRMVLYLGLGGACEAEQQAGDVIVTGSARFELRGELASAPFNRRTVGGTWTPKEHVFEGLAFAPLREPALLPPSPHYRTSAALPQPPPHTPRVRVETRPVLTRPRLTETFLDIPTPDSSDKYDWEHGGSAADMDAAPVGDACDEHTLCGFVIGLASPAIRRFPYDHQHSLRDAWTKHMLQAFARAAARNAASVALRIIQEHGSEFVSEHLERPDLTMQNAP